MSVDHSVELVMQTQQMSCWAASTAMMLGYKNNQSYPESAVLQQFAEFGADGADEGECKQLAFRLGFNVLPNQCSTPEGWEQLLGGGPIMVGTPSHVFVLAGIYGDGTDAGTQFHVLDPARGDIWPYYADVESQYELNPAAGYDTNLFQW
jgi:ABC-type bacteriocin/lantibiotic exporter with double-glycine peptidase domain